MSRGSHRVFCRMQPSSSAAKAGRSPSSSIDVDSLVSCLKPFCKFGPNIFAEKTSVAAVWQARKLWRVLWKATSGNPSVKRTIREGAFAQLARTSKVPNVTETMVPQWAIQMSNRMAAQFRLISQEVSKTKAINLSLHRSVVSGACVLGCGVFAVVGWWLSGVMVNFGLQAPGRHSIWLEKLLDSGNGGDED